MLNIYGPGGIGGLIAGVLAKNGQKVAVVATNQTAKIINEQGITIDSKKFGKFTVEVQALTSPQRGSDILVTTKSYALPAIEKSIRSARPKELCALFNGFDHARHIHSLNEAESWSGAAYGISERVSPGVIHHTSNFFKVELPDMAMDGEISRVLLNGGIDVFFRGTEQQVLWRKLRNQCAMALLTTATGRPIGRALDQSPKLAQALCKELAHIATLENVPTRPAEIYSFLTKLPPDSTSSLARDAHEGNRTELHALGSAVLEEACRLGVPTPALSAAVAAAEENIRGRR
ncbi:2-dehydropantoate 2-reductase N-terminal domain-containing protein [Actinotignum urinale]|uniref:ketopantoate reductase family protein n=1 Tax=Actinotignum urinale TaxID=190146 RepID=UPI002A8248C5|nr:2-dehydropantoate 2-reductase N-terminal domain-containing protein [Actinotignum urinale]MDY5129390.1 2-dehydropantoate 2-reductase N-terminal domain-containing protein [Actinotignum urinale]